MALAGAAAVSHAGAQAGPAPRQGAVAQAPVSGGGCADVRIDPSGKLATLRLTRDEITRLNGGRGHREQAAMLAAIGKGRIYRCFRDSFDFVFLVQQSALRADGSPGFDQFNLKRAYLQEAMGSASALQSVSVFPRLSHIAFGATLHELAHTWANYSVPAWGWKARCEAGADNNSAVELLTVGDQDGADDRGHWGISDVHGQLGGFDARGGGITVKNGVFTAEQPFSYNSADANTQPYAPLELFLMGLARDDEVPVATVYQPRPGTLRYRCDEGRLSFEIQDVQRYDAARIRARMAAQHLELPAWQPVGAGPRRYRLLPLVVWPKDRVLPRAALDEVLAQLGWFTHHDARRPWEGQLTTRSGRVMSGQDMRDNLFNFFQATRGRAYIEVPDLLEQRR
jgi:hypothetical protein